MAAGSTKRANTNGVDTTTFRCQWRDKLDVYAQHGSDGC